MRNEDDGRDPARIASAQPEARTPDQPVHAVGIGPGDPAYLTPHGRRKIAAADFVVGFETVVEFITHLTDATILSCGYDDEADTLAQFAERVADGATGTAVLMGDPNVSGYQFLGKIERAVDRAVRVIPGISSIQLAAGRARTPLEASTVVTLHKRGSLDADLDRLVTDAGNRHLLIFPRPFDWMPERIAAFLISEGVPGSLDALVLEHLTHDTESITRDSLQQFADTPPNADKENTRFSDMSVFVIRRPE